MASQNWMNIFICLALCAAVCTAQDKPIQNPGSIFDADVTNPELQAALDYAVPKVVKSINSKEVHQVVKILEAKKQIVAGTLYHFKLEMAASGSSSHICTAKVLVQPWEVIPMKVTHVQCTPSETKRKTIAGGVFDADINSPAVKSALNFAVPEVVKSINSPKKHTVIKVLDAKQQIVAGTLYHFKLELASTDGNQICEAKVLVQPWEKQEKKLTNVQCSPAAARTTRDLPGGLKDVDVNRSDVKAAAAVQSAQLHLNRVSKSNEKQEVVQVLEAKTQVVAGTMYHLKLKLANAGSKKVSQICSVRVLSQPWLDKTEVTVVKCTPASA